MAGLIKTWVKVTMRNILRPISDLLYCYNSCICMYCYGCYIQLLTHDSHMQCTFIQGDDSNSSSDEDSVSALPAPSSDLPPPPPLQATPTKTRSSRVKSKQPSKQSASSAASKAGPRSSRQLTSRIANLQRGKQTGSEPLLPHPFPEPTSSSSDEDTAPPPPLLPPPSLLFPASSPPTSNVAAVTASDPLGVLGSGVEAVTLASLPGEGMSVEREEGGRTKTARLHNGQPQSSLSSAGNSDTADIFEVCSEVGASVDRNLFPSNQEHSLTEAVDKVYNIMKAVTGLRGKM